MLDKVAKLKRQYKKINKNELDQAKLSRYFDLTITDPDDVLKAFKASMLKNYPDPQKFGWSLINKNQASRIISKHMARNTFTSYFEKELFRGVDGNAYKEEVEKYTEGADLVDLLYSSHVLRVKHQESKKNIVLYPSAIPRLGFTPHEQKMRSGLDTLKSKWFQDWLLEFDKGKKKIKE